MLDPKGMEAARQKGREIAGNQPGALVEAFAECAAAGASAYLAHAGEPIAWLRKAALDALTNTETVGFEGVQTMLSREKGKYNTIPVYAAPQAQARVKVKPLVWVAEGDALFAAKSLVGHYVIGKDEKGNKGWQWGLVGDPRDWAISEFFATSEEAKAAAQADYERSIRSALDEQGPAPADDRVVEAMPYAWANVRVEDTGDGLIIHPDDARKWGLDNDRDYTGSFLPDGRFRIALAQEGR